MYIRDTSEGYGFVSRLLHWLMAIAIFAMFILGLWMVRLDYYSPYYNSAPDIHRSVGMILLFALLCRFLWRASNPKPSDAELSPLERKASFAVHWGFYILLLALMISGYLISTPDGDPISVFGWFDVPALIKMPGLETPAGNVHRVLAYVTIALAAIHTAAALKHHVIDKSTVLTRMWSGPPNSSRTSEKGNDQ
ncbi:cytochrome b [Hyphomicrobium sp.]|jgi:cytochrome b561|uniref:cytochrome b n=1 Tax=Hyphomicrobium sp. TaxID=82 RepID=UPI0035652D90